MKIIVYEHVSGGGYAEQPIPTSVLAEGFGMLREIVTDFTAAGHEVTVLLDARIAKLHPPLDVFCILPIYFNKESERFLKNVATINDATYIIAPETGQTLQSLVELAEQTGKISLNCESKAIKTIADKAALYEDLQKKGFRAPKTLVLNRSDSLAQVKQAIKRELSYPVILKPIDGVGCGGLSIIKEEIHVNTAIEKVKAVSNATHFVVQQFIVGEAVSLSLLCNDKKAMALSLNRQSITLAEPNETSSYDGGCVPFNHPLEQEALSLAEKIVESFSGLWGYVGVDLVLAKDYPYIVDVNPRLTTSYVGLSKVANFNVAEALINSVINGQLPFKHENRGFACFSKIETHISSAIIFQKAAQSYNIISPPFPLGKKTKSYSLVIGEGESLDKAKLDLEEAKKNLLNNIP
jgi:hypothetical protein